MILTTKTRLLALSTAVAALMATTTVAAQTINWNPRTGDVWIDQRLGDINQYGTRYREPFIDEMTRYHGVPRDLVSELLARRGWTPGDVYYACSIAQIAGRPCRDVADQWEDNRGQGWGVMAQRLGIKPGSAAFHRLKKGFVPTYDRWGRPLVLDADLRREFPNHGKKVKKTKVKGHAMDTNHEHGSRHDGAHADYGKADHGKVKSAGNGKGKSSGKSADKAKGGKKG